jgi:hypothetical protein
LILTATLKHRPILSLLWSKERFRALEHLNEPHHLAVDVDGFVYVAAVNMPSGGVIKFDVSLYGKS